MPTITLTATTSHYASALGAASNDTIDVAGQTLYVDTPLTGITLTTNGGGLITVGTNTITLGAHSNHTFTGTLTIGAPVGYIERTTGTTYVAKGGH